MEQATREQVLKLCELVGNNKFEKHTAQAIIEGHHFLGLEHLGRGYLAAVRKLADQHHGAIRPDIWVDIAQVSQQEADWIRAREVASVNLEHSLERRALAHIRALTRIAHERGAGWAWKKTAPQYLNQSIRARDDKAVAWAMIASVSRAPADVSEAYIYGARDNFSATLILIEVGLQQGSLEQAEILARRIRDNANDLEPLALMARALVKLNRINTTDKAIEIAHEIAPNPLAVDIWCEVYRATGERQALAWAKRYVDELGLAGDKYFDTFAHFATVFRDHFGFLTRLCDLTGEPVAEFEDGTAAAFHAERFVATARAIFATIPGR